MRASAARDRRTTGLGSGRSEQGIDLPSILPDGSPATTQELSWLQFNRRVLAQTSRGDFPILERLRFLAIWASNMDEFFAARISRAFLEERGKDSYRALLREAR